MKRRIVVLGALFVLIISLILSIVACAPENIDDDIERPTDNEEVEVEDIIELPEYVFPESTTVNLSEGDVLCFVDFATSICAAYQPNEDYEREYLRAYDYWMEVMVERQGQIEEALGRAGATENELLALMNVFIDASDWLKTTKGGIHRYLNSEYYTDLYILNLLVDYEALGKLQEYIHEIIEIFPSERSAILVFDIFLRVSSAKSVYPYLSQVEDAKDRGFSEVESLLRAQGNIEEEYISRGDFAFLGEVAYKLISVLLKFDSVKLGEIANLIVHLSKFENFNQFKGAGGYSYKEMVAILNYTGELISEFEVIGNEQWIELITRVIRTIYTLGVKNDYRLITIDMVKLLKMKESFSCVKLIGNVMKGLKVSDVINIYADFDDWYKAKERDKSQKLAVLVARISGLLADAYEKLTPEEQTQLMVLFSNFDGIIQSYIPNIDVDYDLVKMSDFWGNINKYSAFGTPEKLTTAEKQEIAAYANGLMDIFSRKVPHEEVYVEQPISYIIDTKTTKVMFLDVVNGMQVSVTDYVKNEDGSYFLYNYDGKAMFIIENIVGWKTTPGKHNIILKMDNQRLELEGAALEDYPARVFDIELEIFVYSEDNSLSCNKYYTHSLYDFFFDDEITQSDLSGLFIFENFPVTFDAVKQVKLYGFETGEVGYNKIGYGIAEFGFATVAFSVLYNVLTPPST